VEFHRSGDGLIFILNKIVRRTLHFPENSDMTCVLGGLTVGNQPPGN
jgi:hypothetical protein